MNRFKQKAWMIIVLLSILAVLSSPSAYAAFPVKAKAVAAPAEKETATHIIGHEKLNKAIEKLQKKIKKKSQMARPEDATLNVVSFVIAIFGFIALIAAAITYSVVPLLIAFLLGLAAVIMGSIASRHPGKNRGYGIAGLALGVIDIIIAAIVVGELVMAGF